MKGLHIHIHGTPSGETKERHLGLIRMAYGEWFLTCKNLRRVRVPSLIAGVGTVLSLWETPKEPLL